VLQRFYTSVSEISEVSRLPSCGNQETGRSEETQPPFFWCVEGRLQTFGSVLWLLALSRNADSCLRVRLCSASTRCLSDCASANFAWRGDTSYRNNCLSYAEMDLLRLLYTYIRAISDTFLFYGFLLYFNHTWNKTTVITYVPIKNVAEVAPARGSRCWGAI